MEDSEHSHLTNADVQHRPALYQDHKRPEYGRLLFLPGMISFSAFAQKEIYEVLNYTLPAVGKKKRRTTRYSYTPAI